jgi:hypothetical protein
MDRRALTGSRKSAALSYWRGMIFLLVAQAVGFSIWFVPWALALDLAALAFAVLVYRNVRDRGDETLSGMLSRLRRRPASADFPEDDE